MTSKNQEWGKRAQKVTPGPQSNYRRQLYLEPRFIVKGKGARVWDADGKEYVDFYSGHGPGILGYSNQELIQTLKTQLDTLYFLATLSGQNPLEVELAEKFVKHVPCCDMARFVVTGTDTDQLVIRLARAYTKRNLFIRFEGHYHGWMDNILGGAVDDAAIAAGEPPYAVESEKDYVTTQGRDPDAFHQSFKLPWNDIEVLERVLEKYGEQIALILMEVYDCNGGNCPPRPGYLEKVKELCAEYGILLSFDEVITGWRVGLNSAQGEVGVTPDLSTFGKAMAAGLPMGAVTGRRDIMNLLAERKVVGAGTFNGNPLCLAASLATIKILERDNGAFYKKIERIQNQLTDGLKELGKKHGIPILCQGPPRGTFSFHFLDKPVAYSIRELKEADTEKQAKFVRLWEEEGTLGGSGRFHVCDAITDADIDWVLSGADRAMSRL